MPKLSIIGTPIGNLEDITFRAVRTLSECDAVVCEDTREAYKLLSHYKLEKSCIPANAHTSDGTFERILSMLREGKHLAYISDAGTPGVSDPGSLLVAKVREALPEVIIEAIPGPSALTAALSISGVPVSEFVFLGFLPHKKGRETLLRECIESPRPVAFFESPHRIMKALEKLIDLQGEATVPKKVIVCRELTKVFEEVVSGTPQEVTAYFTTHPDKVRGEFVVIVS